MAECYILCQLCDAPVAPEDAHDFHDPLDCDRALNGFCRCGGAVCPVCCPEPECSPLQLACQEAREHVRTRAADWEAAQTVPASTEGAATVPSHPLTGFYFGGVG